MITFSKGSEVPEGLMCANVPMDFLGFCCDVEVSERHGRFFISPARPLADGESVIEGRAEEEGAHVTLSCHNNLSILNHPIDHQPQPVIDVHAAKVDS